MAAEVVREALDEPAMIGIRPAAMGNAIGLDRAAAQMPIESRAAILCWSSANLARANSCASMPAGAVGARICAGAAGAGGTGAPSGGVAGAISDGSTLELAAEESIAPAAPIAPSRNISRLFNDIPTLRL